MGTDNDTDIEFVTEPNGIETLSKAIDGFDRIAISDGFAVRITSAPRFGLILRVVKEAVPMLVTRCEHGRLHLGLDRELAATVLEAVIIAPDLQELEVTRRSNVVASGFEMNHSLNIAIGGASTVDASLSCADATLILSGSSQLILRGRADAMTLVAGEASQADLSRFSTAATSVTLGSGSRASINPRQPVTASLGNDAVLQCPITTSFDEFVASSTAHLVRVQV
jgi:hypothetical protein